MSSAQSLDWERASLGDLFRIKHGYAFKGEFFTDSGDLIVLTPGNFEPDGGVKLKGDKEKFYKGTFPSEFLLSRGDLLIVMTDLTQNAPILGSAAFVPRDNRYLHNQRLGKIVNLKEDRVAERFLYYLFNSPHVRSAIKASATGATVRHTAPERIYRIEVNLPPLLVQDRIASILSAYDDLIEDNTRRIAILEEMARALYQEWFVHFRFPGHEHVPLVDSPLGPIPEGWKPHVLGDIAQDHRRGVQPEAVDRETPCVGLEHIPRRSLVLSEWGNASDVQSTKLRFRKGEILFGKIRPYFHKVSVAPMDGVCSSDAIVISAKDTRWWAMVLMCVSSDQFVAHAVQTSNGTKMPRANWDVLLKYGTPIPPDDLLNDFNRFVTDAVDQMHGLISKNRNLCTTRDLLLPKLISGEIDVSAVSEEPIAEAAD